MSHWTLDHKLKDFGVGAKVISLIAQSLKGRSFRVRVEGWQSERGLLHSGGPRASVLGPPVLLIYVIDIVNRLEIPCSTCANNIKQQTVGLTRGI